MGEGAKIFQFPERQKDEQPKARLAFERCLKTIKSEYPNIKTVLEKTDSGLEVKIEVSPDYDREALTQRLQTLFTTAGNDKRDYIFEVRETDTNIIIATVNRIL